MKNYTTLMLLLVLITLNSQDVPTNTDSITSTPTKISNQITSNNADFVKLQQLSAVMKNVQQKLTEIETKQQTLVEITVLQNKIDEMQTRTNEYVTLQNTIKGYFDEISLNMNSSDKDKYEILKNNLSLTNNAYNDFSTSILSLDSKLSSAIFLAEIIQISNPESKVLGVSFSKKIEEMIDKILFNNVETKGWMSWGPTKGEVLRDKIKESSKGFLNNPLLQIVSPFAPTLVSASNALLGMVETLFISQNDMIKPDDLTAFKKELSNYLVVYSQLSHATEVYKKKISLHMFANNTLKRNVYNHIDSSLTNLGKHSQISLTNLGKLSSINKEFNIGDSLSYISAYYRDNYRILIGNTLTNNENQTNTLGYTNFLRTCTVFKNNNNTLEDLVIYFNQFKNLNAVVDNDTQIYTSEIISALNKGVEQNCFKKDSIDTITKKLVNLKDDCIKKFNTSSKIDQTNNTISKFKYKIKIL